MLFSDKREHVIEVGDISPEELPDLGIPLAQSTNDFGVVAKCWAGGETLRGSRRVSPPGELASSIDIDHQFGHGATLKYGNGRAVVQELVDVVEVAGPAAELFDLAGGRPVMDEGQFLGQGPFWSEDGDLEGSEIAVVGTTPLGDMLGGQPQQRLDDTAPIGQWPAPTSHLEEHAFSQNVDACPSWIRVAGVEVPLSFPFAPVLGAESLASSVG
jgi:hypothetical protein